MAIRVKVDEDLPKQVADLFTERGHDAATVVRQGWQGLPDIELWPRVQQEGRLLVTADKGFADLRTYPPGSHAGVLLFRLEEESRRGYLELTRAALQRLDLETLAGAVIVVTLHGIRIRKALTDCEDVEKLRIVERLRELDDRMLERQQSKWDDRSDWLTNAETEHSRSRFRAILARNNPNQRDFVLEGDTVEERHPLWKTRTSPVVARTAQEMSACVAPLLRVSNEILFIDPHFGPENPRYRRPLEALLATTLKQHCGVPPEKVEIHTGEKSKADFFKEQCSQLLPNIIPHRMHVRLVRWRQKDRGEKLHNRYILTDKGGVSLGVGLDDGRPGETDEIKLLDEETYKFRWKQYTSEPAFDLVDEIVVEGRRTLRA